jgi:hypothetical protein
MLGDGFHVTYIFCKLSIKDRPFLLITARLTPTVEALAKLREV